MKDRPLRILLINSATKWIGEAAHVFDLYRELRNAGHQPIFGCRRGSKLDEAAAAAQYRIEHFHFLNGFKPVSDWHDVRHLRRIIREEQIDIVHCHRGKDHWLAAAAMLTGTSRAALVRTRHVVTPAKGHIVNRWLYRSRTQYILAVSGRVMDALGPLLPLIPETRRRVIYSSVHLEKFTPQKRSEDRRAQLGVHPGEMLIGLIARYQNIKGQHIFLDAAAAIAPGHPQARFLVAGRSTPSRRERYWNKVKQAGLEDRFHVLGYQEDLPQLLASLDIGVVASLGSEGSSRVSLECLASGVPVVATTVGGIPELLQGGRYGILVEPNNARALAEGIETLLADAQLREDLKREGRAYAESERNYRRWIGEIEEAYRSVLD